MVSSILLFLFYTTILLFFSIILLSIQKVIFKYCIKMSTSKQKRDIEFFQQIYYFLKALRFFPFKRSLTFLQQGIFYVLFFMALLQWIFLPLTSFFPPDFNILCLIFLFQLRFSLDLFNLYLNNPSSLKILIKRKIVQHFTSQAIIIIALPSLLFTQTPFSNNIFYRLIIFVLTFIAMICQNERGPFKLSLPEQKWPSNIYLNYDSYHFFFFQISQMLNFMFSMALLVNVTNISFYTSIHIGIKTIVFFILKIIILILFCFIGFSFFPIYRTHQHKTAFKKIGTPLLGGLLFIFIFAKFLRD